jgi:hypothetical protein
MSTVITTPYMNLPNPVPGADPGPDYADNLESSLTIIDQHNHSFGSGQQIQPNGLNISSDLSFLNNNAIQLRTTRYTPQSAALALVTDIGCLYVVNNELYYNDVTGGNKIQITSNGTVNSGAGSISGLPSGTASAAYSAGTFVWQSATATAANMDAGSYIFRNSTPSSDGLTLQAPVLSTNYSVTLPSLPLSTSIMTLDSSGNMAAPYPVAAGLPASVIVNNSITESKMAPLSIGTPELINASVTQPKRAALGQQISGSSGNFANTNAGTTVDVPNMSVTITTTGRPVWVGVQSVNNTGTPSFITTTATANFNIVRDNVTTIAVYQLEGNLQIPSSSIYIIDVPSAATHTYKLTLTNVNASNAEIDQAVLVAYEL